VPPTYATCFGPLPFTWHEAERTGISRDTLRLLVAGGKVRRLLRGVFVESWVPDALELRAAAIGKVVPAGTVVCGRTAAWLWGVDALAMSRSGDLPPVDVMGLPGTSRSRRSDTFGSTGPLLPEDVVEPAGVEVTTPARTAADLSRLLARPDALAALDVLVGLPAMSGELVNEVLDRFAGYRGVIQARELVQLADPRAESPQESRTRLRCVDAGFPCPEPQIEVFDETDDLIARLDMGWRELLKALEFDGDEGHSSSEQQTHDLARRKRVERRGWDVAVVTSEHVLSRSLAFERGVEELLGMQMRLTRNHPRFGGWDPRSRWAAV
jgi:hypothetical protein